MKVETLIKILQQCNPDDDVMFFQDDEVSHILHVEQSVTDETIYLYEFKPNFTEQSEGRNVEIIVHFVECFDEENQFVKTTYIKRQEQKHQQMEELSMGGDK